MDPVNTRALSPTNLSTYFVEQTVFARRTLFPTNLSTYFVEQSAFAKWTLSPTDLSTYSVEQSLPLDHRDCLAIFALYDIQ